MEKTKVTGGKVLEEVLYPLDPCQMEALESWHAGSAFRISSAYAQKLIETILACIGESLYHGKKLRIQCADDTLIPLLEKALNEKGLIQLCWKDGKPMADDWASSLILARNKSVDHTLVQQQRAYFTGLSLKRENLWKEIGEPQTIIFGEHSWLQVLARSIFLEGNEDKALLTVRLSGTDFEWVPSEFWMTRGRVESFNKLSDLKHADSSVLRLLNLKVLEGQPMDEVKQSVSKMLSDFKEAGQAILLGYARVIDNYREERQNLYYSEIDSLRALTGDLRNAISQASEVFGEIFLHESSFGSLSHQIRKQFSKSAKELMQARSTIKQKFMLLSRKMQEGIIRELCPDWTDPELLTMETIQEKLNWIEGALPKCHTRVESLLKEQQKRLNANNIQDAHPLLKEIRTFEQSIEKYIREFNESGLFHKPIEINALSLSRKSKVVETLILQCRELRDGLDRLEEFLFWHNFWDKLPENTKLLLKTLEIFEPAKRLQVFDSWYISKLLQKLHRSSFISGNEEMDNYLAEVAEVQKGFSSFLKLMWQGQRHEFLNEIKTLEKEFTRALSRNQLQEMLSHLQFLPTDRVSRLFPVRISHKMPVPGEENAFDGEIFIHSVNAESEQAFTLTFFPQKAKDGIRKEPARHFSLEVPQCLPDFDWSKLSLSNRLHKIKQLSAQFLPFASEVEVYHASKLQIFSFLGQGFDKAILDALGLPFKQMIDKADDNAQQITEALLDNRKPIFILYRDGILGNQRLGALPWQRSTIDLLSSVGLNPLNTWSCNWLKDRTGSIEKLVNAMLGCIQQPAQKGVEKPADKVTDPEKENVSSLHYASA